jgi:hypothetical protein
LAPQVWNRQTSSNPLWNPTTNVGSLSSIKNIQAYTLFSGGNVNFVFDVNYPNGGGGTYQFSFSLSTYSDPDNNFQVGVVSASGTCGSCLEKHLQVGVESPTNNLGWWIDYNIGPKYVYWYNSPTSTTSWAGSGVSAYATQGTTSYIADDGSTGGTIYLVGGSNYANANALYYLSNNQYPRGVADWYAQSGTQTISEGTQFW